MDLFLLSYPFFFLSLFCMFTLKICVRIFLGGIETTCRMLKLCVHMDDELWYGVIEDQAHCLILPFIYPFSVSSR